MIRRPPRSTLFPTRRSSDLPGDPAAESRPSGAASTSTLRAPRLRQDRKSTRLNSSHLGISYAVFCLKKKKKKQQKQKKMTNDTKKQHTNEPQQHKHKHRTSE